MSVPLEHDYIGLSDASRSSVESSNISSDSDTNNVLNLKATELSLGLPGFSKNFEENGCCTKFEPKNFMLGAKRGFSDVNLDVNGGFEKVQGLKGDLVDGVVKVGEEKKKDVVPSAKAQVVGWPPIRSFRKNTMTTNVLKNGDAREGSSGSGGCLYVKVSMDGAPYLRKIDLKVYNNYAELSKALEKMFSCFTLGQCTSNGIRGREGLSESNLKDLLHGSECVLTYEDKDGDWMLVGDVPWEMFIDSCKRLRIMKGSEAIGLAPRSVDKGKNRN
ncbi:PB1 domain, AUX/IAA protein [Artemisia annua]|uniref:Auxin-responsive protein n=1 Tax=Artemisia annua TaxID=35608 RepID=A0A2U1M2N6_ARTAN|nr:PB1 domain, AUX/IAA protein [Artemisia annua]